jgi:hypothetical protein
MTKKTRRRLALAGGSGGDAFPPATANPLGEVRRCDLVTFGSSSLWVLTTPDLTERLLSGLKPNWVDASRG